MMCSPFLTVRFLHIFNSLYQFHVVNTIILENLYLVYDYTYLNQSLHASATITLLLGFPVLVFSPGAGRKEPNHNSLAV